MLISKIESLDSVKETMIEARKFIDENFKYASDETKALLIASFIQAFNSDSTVASLDGIKEVLRELNVTVNVRNIQGAGW